MKLRHYLSIGCLMFASVVSIGFVFAQEEDKSRQQIILEERAERAANDPDYVFTALELLAGLEEYATNLEEAYVILEEENENLRQQIALPSQIDEPNSVFQSPKELMEELNSIKPDELQLTSIRFVGNLNGNESWQFELGGSASRINLISELMRGLENSDSFSYVNLRQVRRDEEANRSDFIMDVEVTSP